MSPPFRLRGLSLALVLVACSAPGAVGPVPYQGEPSWDQPLAPPSEPASEAPPALPVPSTAASSSAAPVPTDAALARTARLLAGLSTDAPRPSQRARFEQHARAASASFDAFEERAGKALLAWSHEHLAEASGQTVLYPFGGPDLVTVHRFYPHAGRYVLVALQEGGPPPALEGLSDDELDHVLDVHQTVFDAFARRGFFITAQMGEGYRGARGQRGISGVLLAFAEREGLEVVSLEPVRIAAQGGELEVHPGDRQKPETWSSLRLHLRRREDGARVELDYLQLDLSDAWLGHDAPSLAWLRARATGPTVLKAASHLPQQPGFHLVRDLIAEHATQLVQDETGLPYTLLEGPFEVKLFGSFRSVNGLFDGRPQRALRDAYQQRRDIGPLPFPIGYRKAAGSALMVATRRSLPQ